MSSFDWPDLSRLALLARDRNLDVRPVLLRAHTDLFVGAPSRDRATIEAFEALALGFLPIVDDATAAAVAQKLAPVADTPSSVIDILIRRGGEARAAVLAEREGAVCTPEPHDYPQEKRDAFAVQAPGDRTASENEDIDLLRALDRRARLGGTRLRELVARGREHPQLAMALLNRDDLDVSDEAVLYLHADDARRTLIRTRLEPIIALAGRSPSLGRPDEHAIESLLSSARALDIAAVEAQIAKMLNLAPTPAWRFQMESRRELLAFALVAAGIAAEDCVRIFLTLHPAISRSVRTVFHLAQIARSVPRPMAIYLLEAVLDVAIEARRDARYVPAADPSIASARNHAARPTVSQIRARVLARRAG